MGVIRAFVIGKFPSGLPLPSLHFLELYKYVYSLTPLPNTYCADYCGQLQHSGK